MDLTEIEEKVNSLREIEELTPVEAMSGANEIVKAINKVVEVQEEEEDYETLEKLYEKAANTYLLAAEKVPRESRDRVAFPANFWSMRARQVRLMLRKPSAPRFKAAPISTPLRSVGSGTITPPSNSEIDISKPIREMELQYAKVEIEDVIRGYELKVEPIEPTTPLFLSSPEIELKDVVAQYAVRSVPLEVESNIEPLPKPAKDVFHEQQDIYKGVLSIDTIGGQYYE